MRIHLRKIELAPPIIYFLLLLVIIGDVLVGYWIFISPTITRFWGFGLHFILAVCCALLLRNLDHERSPAGDNFVYVASILSFVLPVYGMVAMSLVYLAMRFIKVKPGDYFVLDDEFLPKRLSFLIKQQGSMINYKIEELEIDAYRDIFTTQDKQLEENAIHRLSKQVNRQSVSILKDVVKTSSSDTGIMAASALIDMEDKITKKIEGLRDKLSVHAGDSELVFELARTYDLYCYLGVLDSAIESYYINLAIEKYSEFLDLYPDHDEAMLEYGRVLLNAGMRDKAIETLNQVVASSPNDPNPYIWLAEAYYESEDYESTTKVCQKLSSLARVPGNFKSVLNCWTSESMEQTNDSQPQGLKIQAIKSSQQNV